MVRSYINLFINYKIVHEVPEKKDRSAEIRHEEKYFDC